MGQWNYIISYQNVCAGISSHIYTAIESAGNDKDCMLHLTLYTYSILYLCIMQIVPVPKIVVTKKMRFVVINIWDSVQQNRACGVISL